MRLAGQLQETLQKLEEKSLRRRLRTVSGLMAPSVMVDGKKVLCFCSNNYLGFAQHTELMQAAKLAIDEHGLGAGASRLVSGNLAAHRQAEQALAEYLHTDAALLFSSGYAANVSIIAAICTPEDVIFGDRLNHASLIDGCRLSRASMRVYRHNDLQHLQELLQHYRGKAKRALIVSDAVFSMDGDLASVTDLRQLADRYDCALMIDEAHALGVLGPQGRGLCAEQNVTPDIYVGTLGKSFGLAGAFVAASQSIVDYLSNRARGFVFSTGIPPFMAAVIAGAVPLVQNAEQERASVLAYAQQLRHALRLQGYNVTEGRTPIVPVLIGQAGLTMQLSSQLLQRGIFVQGIRPPTVPEGTSRLRVVPMASHSPEQVDQAIAAFQQLHSS